MGAACEKCQQSDVSPCRSSPKRECPPSVTLSSTVTSSMPNTNAIVQSLRLKRQDTNRVLLLDSAYTIAASLTAIFSMVVKSVFGRCLERQVGYQCIQGTQSQS